MSAKPMRLSFLFILALSECSVWVKPGATEGDFNVAKGQCTGAAYSQIPPAMVTTQVGGGYTTPSTTSCYGSGYAATCTTTGGQYVAPTPITYDANASARTNAFNGCMYRGGWSLQRR